MGEKVEGAKNEGEKKAADAGGKKVDDGLTTVVLKTDIHCEGCAKKIKRAVKNFPGVEQVKTDAGANKVTVTGKVDPASLKEKLEQKIKKKVELVTPQPAKKEGGGGGGEKKAEEKSEKTEKPSEKKAEEKKAADKPTEKEAASKESTVVLKIRLHCEGCIQKMRSKIMRFKGVSDVSFDMAKDMVTVKGNMDMKALIPYIQEKFKRPVDVAPAAKKDDGAGAKKDEKKEAAGGGEKKEGGGKKEEKKEGKEEAAPATDKKEEKKESAIAAAGGGGGDAVVKKSEYSGYPYAASTSYWYDPGHVYNHNKFVMEAQEHQAHVSQGYGNYNYATSMEHYSAPQMFSDENGCSVM